ncbi:hypothetical protein [Stigmatella aurantiaca]|uniref:DUF1080 domain-containing protein n=1 Tax=Stigmatella aurantiaca (strain DW4/3-1) TaxID=378806 RepID=Q093Q9_STIAD|nr:hypothetical protein [Stigmatella aurantiaca]ADO71070.1 uncharacterized protein STAUR_3278 [Stigmatella aurantiaca DW4/3-1]EAU66984.1 hypothetical protein STIAU_4632 [Stigmatella aurantiaca DW4/3-1]
MAFRHPISRLPGALALAAWGALALPFPAGAQVPGWSAMDGHWALTGGVISQQEEDPLHLDGFYATPAHVLQKEGVSGKDCVLEAEMGTAPRSDHVYGWNAVGFAFGIQDARNFYRVHFFPGYPGGELRFEKVVDGLTEITQAAYADFTPSPGEFYTLRLDIQGPALTARLRNGAQGELTLTYTDPAFSGGGVGLSNDAGPGFFRKVRLCEQP